jgi:outer membrane protein
MNNTHATPCKKWIFLIVIMINSCFAVKSYGQQRTLTLQEAIDLAIANSNTLKLDQAKIEQTISLYKQTKDGALPSGSMSATFSHMEIPADHIRMGSFDWIMGKRGETYMGNAALNETIFNGFKLKYARRSAQLLTALATLDLAHNKDQVIYTAVEMYHDLFKVISTRKVNRQNTIAIDSLIKVADEFYQHGIVTKNDVLRFRLQKSEIEIMSADLEANRQIINYNLIVLLGLPENTDLEPVAAIPAANTQLSLQQCQEEAFQRRPELQQSGIQSEIDKTSIRAINANVLPTLSTSASVDYIHAGSAFIPVTGSFISPFSLGATLSWNFSSLWQNKHKIAEVLKDAIKKEVNECYQHYLQAVNRIQLLQTAIDQATENDRMQADKYKSNITSVTDLIDADTRLYQVLTNMEIARSDASLSWFRLLKATGNITTSH